MAALLVCLPGAAGAMAVYGPPAPVYGPPAPAWIRNAVPFTPEPGKALIAVVIDDMGVDYKHSAEALKLPAGVTMSYLPYGREIKKQVAAAKAAGHEVIVHMPMEPMRRTANPGPDYLGVKFGAEELHARLVRNLSAFDGYVGINNHMGSRFTQDRAGLEVVMGELKKRGLMFLDSKTINTSLGEKVAAAHRLPVTHRDVFLDDEETETFTEGALEKVEAYARRHGSAVAIGHPKAITLKDLNAWTPGLAARGFQLAPLTAVLKYRMSHSAEKRVAGPETGKYCEMAVVKRH